MWLNLVNLSGSTNEMEGKKKIKSNINTIKIFLCLCFHLNSSNDSSWQCFLWKSYGFLYWLFTNIVAVQWKHKNISYNLYFSLLLFKILLFALSFYFVQVQQTTTKSICHFYFFFTAFCCATINMTNRKRSNNVICKISFFGFLCLQPFIA